MCPPSYVLLKCKGGMQQTEVVQKENKPKYSTTNKINYSRLFKQLKLHKNYVESKHYSKKLIGNEVL